MQNAILFSSSRLLAVGCCRKIPPPVDLARLAHQGTLIRLGYVAKVFRRIIMYAVFKSGGKQHRVQEGDTVKLEKLEVETGSAMAAMAGKGSLLS